MAATLALAGCGSSSNSTVTINQQQPQPEPELEQEPQTGGGSGEGEGDGSGGGSGGGTAPPTDTTTTEDGDGDTDSGDTPTTGDGDGDGQDGGSPGGGQGVSGGQIVTQQPEQEPPQSTQQLSNQQPLQTGGGSRGGTGAQSVSSGGPGSPTIDIDSFKLHAGIDQAGWWNYAPAIREDGLLQIISDTRYLLYKKTKTADNDFGWKGYRWESVESDGSIIEAQTYEKTILKSTPGQEFSYVYNGARTSPHLGQYGNFSDGLLVLSGSPERRHRIHFTGEGLDLRSGLNEFGTVTSLNSQGTFVLPGTYDGVAGLYKCYSDPVNTCSIKVHEDGFPELGTFNINEKRHYQSTVLSFSIGNYWLFQPYNLNEVVPRTIETAGRIFSYGWWLRKPTDAESNYFADGGANTEGIGNYFEYSGGLRGTANYIGGAAGIYAFVHGNEPGDATNFTARARLTVDFDSNKVKGKIDDFKFGPGGRTDWSERRDWSVELMEHGFGNSGTINPGKTMWTMAGKGFDAGGEWGVDFANQDLSVITGSFYAVYGAIGKMVGGFGVEREE